MEGVPSGFDIQGFQLDLNNIKHVVKIKGLLFNLELHVWGTSIQ